MSNVRRCNSRMSTTTKFISATPVLASLDIERSAEFFASKLGFTKVHVAQGEYGIVSNGPAQIHFWACTDRHIAEATGCRVQVQAIDGLRSEEHTSELQSLAYLVCRLLL